MLDNKTPVNNQPDCLAQEFLIPYLCCCALTHVGLLVYRTYIDKYNLKQDNAAMHHNMTAYLLFVLFLMGGWTTFVIIQESVHPLPRDEHGKRQHIPDSCNLKKVGVIAGTSFTLLFNQTLYAAGQYFCKKQDAKPQAELRQELLNTEVTNRNNIC